MKIIIFLFMLLCISNYNLNGQFFLEVKSDKANACQKDTVQFTVTCKNGANLVDGVSYKWSFGDGSAIEAGLNLDTVKHIFKKGSGYFIRVDAQKGNYSDYVIKKFEVAITPNFSGTTSDHDDPICLGQEVFLTGKIADSTWKYELPAINKEESPALTAKSNVFQSLFDYRNFNKNQKIVDANDIDTVGITLEHSNLSQTKVELICPNNTSIILKDFGGSNKYFGEPIVGGNSDLPGIGYNYYWTNSAEFGKMNSVTPTGSSLKAGSYTPEQSFSLLTGCPLNGEWIVKVTDNQLPDSGFVFSSQLTFEESLLPADWQFKPTYSSPVWTGSGVSSTTSLGLATAIPEVYDNNGYIFRVKDNFGCLQSKTIIVVVDHVNFSVDPITGDFPLNVTFDDSTSWAVEYIWDFGDDSDFGSGDTITHTYTKDGEFWAKLTAIADDGCQDTSYSQLITITIPPAVMPQIPNVFTPNGDGKNDYFRLTENLDGIQTFNFWIYSRWGKKMAEWHSIEEAKIGWDGNYEGGQKASPGVYYYIIRVKGFNGYEEEDKGSIQLFR